MAPNDESNGESEKASGEPGLERADEPRWLGTKRFWLTLVAVVVAVTLVLVLQNRRLGRPDALVPVVSIAGPREVKAGATLRYSVLVRDRFGAPIPEAPVRVGFWNTDLVELARGETGEAGEVAVEIRFPDDFQGSRSLVVVADVGVVAGKSYLDVSAEKPERRGILVSTDKPLYQPGQTVHIRALAMSGERPLADEPMVVEIHTADRIKVFRSEKKSSGFGVISADFVLADQLKLGAYTIAVSNNARTVRGERAIEVKRYALPKLKVELGDVSALNPDAPLRGKARASWIFGDPVTQGGVTLSLEKSGTVVRSVTGQLDKDGRFPFELPAKGGAESDGTFTLRARVEAEGGMQAETTTELSSSRTGGIKLEAFPESGSLIAGVPQTVFVVISSEPMAGVSVRTVPNGVVMKTSEQGIAKLVIHPDPPDPNLNDGWATKEIGIEAFRNDGSVGTIALKTALRALVVKPDREAYGPGETAHVRVLGAPRGDHINVHMTRGDTPIATGTCVAASLSGGCSVALTPPAGASGLAWVHALSLPAPGRDRQWAATGRDVKVGKRLVLLGHGTRHLDLQVTPDKKLYAPRETGTIDVAVTGLNGSPVKAELGASVTDEAVFRLAAARPDLERNFFIVQADLAAAQRPFSYDEARAAPPSLARYEPSAAYDASTPGDTRAALLAVLTNLPEAGGFQHTTTDQVREAATEVVDEAKTRLKGWAVVLFMALALATFAAFGAYGVSRFRFAEPVATSEAAQAEFILESRSLLASWLVSVLGPPVLGALAAFLTSLVTGSERIEEILACWAVLALVCSQRLLHDVIRVRRTTVARASESLRRVLFVLPLAALLGHFAILFAFIGERWLRTLLDSRMAFLVVPLLVVAAAQITFGFLSVVRQTLLHSLTRRRKIALLVSRASFLGLPITLVCAVLFVVVVVKERSGASWSDYAELEEVSENADNREGGTGTRAKGEEGSMGKVTLYERSAVGRIGPSAAHAGITRDYFPETLLWAPQVLTDDAGRARIQVPFADSITTWRLALSAVSRTGQLGSSTVPLIVKQDFFVDAELPPVLTQGDELTVPVMVHSYSENSQDVSVELAGDGITTIGPSLIRLKLAPSEARGIRFTLRAHRAGERIVRVKASSATRSDTQERKLKVRPNGFPVARTINGRIQGETATDVELPARAIDGGNDLYVKIYGGPLSQISEGLDGVFRVPHGCFEQTSSTTYPSVLVLDFLRRAKAVSPALEEKARDYIGQGYQRILSFEAPGGGFSLFGKDTPSITLTAYGLHLLSDMARVSVVDEPLLTRLRDFLYTKQSPSGGWAEASSEPKAKAQQDNLLVTAYLAWALAASTENPEQESRLTAPLDMLAKAAGPEANDPYGLALRANALLAGKRVEQARPILDRLALAAERGDDGIHWKSKALGVMYSYGPSMEVEATGLATHALARAQMQPELRAGALDWLVAQRGANGTWSTTQATIAAMRALLDEGRPASKETQEISVLVDGELVETFALESRARDVHRLVNLRKFATTGKHAFTVRSTGDGDVSYQLVAEHYLPWQKASGSALDLLVAYPTNGIVAGTTSSCSVSLKWTGKEAARMPMVEVGVPPAFEVDTDDLDRFLASPGSPVQRYTTERGKVTLYLLSLAEDKPVAMDLKLRALRPARVFAPASAAYLYYEPEVRTETQPVIVQSL